MHDVDIISKMKDLNDFYYKYSVAKGFGCDVSQVCFGNYYGYKVKIVDGLRTCPYVVVMGSVKMEYPRIQSLGNLSVVMKDFDLGNNYSIDSLGILKYVGGNLILSDSLVKDTGDLEYIGGDMDAYVSLIDNFGKIEYIGGNVRFSDRDLEELYNREFSNNFGSKVKVKGKVRSVNVR